MHCAFNSLDPDNVNYVVFPLAWKLKENRNNSILINWTVVEITEPTLTHHITLITRHPMPFCKEFLRYHKKYFSNEL